MVTCCSTHNQTVDVVPHTLPDCVHSVSANPRETFRFPEFVYHPILILGGGLWEPDLFPSSGKRVGNYMLNLVQKKELLTITRKPVS